MQRAQDLNIKYFGNCNFLACAFFDKDKLSEKVSVREGFFTLQDIFRLSENYSPSKEIQNKLRSIANFYLERAIEILDKKPISFSPIDELFIFKIRKLIESILETPFEGIAKPEPLKHKLSGAWSRRIDREHRLVYEVIENLITVLSMKGHY